MNLRLLALAICMSIGAIGCSSSSSKVELAKEETILREVDTMLRNFAGMQSRGPAKVADLAGFENQMPEGYRAVKSGDIVIVWGVKMAGEGEGANAPANVIAYEKKAPTEGGYVLLQNGTVKKLSKEEFESTPKAKN